MPGALLGGVLIGLTEALAGLLFTPSAKSMFAFGHPGAGAAVPAAGHPGKAAAHDRAAVRGRSAPRPGRCSRCCSSALLVAPLLRQRLSAHRPHPHPLFRLYRPGLEHHDGLCRPALARPCALCRARRLHDRGALRAFRHRRRGSACSAAIAGRVAVRRGHRLPRLPLRRRRRLFRHPDHRVRRVRPHRLRPFQLGRRLERLLPAGRQLHAQRSLEPARPADDVLLRDPGADRRGVRCSAASCCKSRIGYYWLAIREDEEAARALGIDTFRYKMYRGRASPPA